MKIIKYQLMAKINHGTEDEPNIVQTFHDCEFRCSNDTFDAAYAVALKEAYNGEVTVEEVEDEETEPTTDSSVWAALDEAYTSGYTEGVDAV